MPYKPKMYAYKTVVNKDGWYAYFYNSHTDTVTSFHNDREGLSQFINLNDFFCGFGCKHYDQYIIKAVLFGMDPSHLYAFSERLISATSKHSEIATSAMPGFKWGYNFHSSDMSDDTKKATTHFDYEKNLRFYLAHMGFDITEGADIDKDITRDVKGINEIFKVRQTYYANKLWLGSEIWKDVPYKKYNGITLTNQKLTAEYLGADPSKKPEEGEVVTGLKYPDTLKWEYIPAEVAEYFNKYTTANLNQAFKDLGVGNPPSIMIGDCLASYGNGGIHGAIANYQYDSAKTDRIMLYCDVTSYYPSLQIRYGFTKYPEALTKLKSARVGAKANGDSRKANALKIPINSVSGAMRASFSDLYDPLNGYAIACSGQLFLTELAFHITQDVPSASFIQLNTDGVFIECNPDDLDAVHAIISEWEQRTGMTMEEGRILKLAQANVNSYAAVISEGGKIKTTLKGPALKRGISQGADFNCNQNALIVAEAVKDYLLDGVPFADTIRGCNDVTKFQYVASATGNNKSCIWDKGDESVELPVVNRVYAARDHRLGTLTSGSQKIKDIPIHCIVDNDNKSVTIGAIDKEYYVALAKKTIEGFIGKSLPEISSPDKTQSIIFDEPESESLLISNPLPAVTVTEAKSENAEITVSHPSADELSPQTPLFDRNGELFCLSFNQIIKVGKDSYFEVDPSCLWNWAERGVKSSFQEEEGGYVVTFGDFSDATALVVTDNSNRMSNWFFPVTDLFSADQLQSVTDDPVILSKIDRYLVELDNSRGLVNDLPADIHYKREGVVAEECFNTDKTVVLPANGTIFVYKMEYQDTPVLHVNQFPFSVSGKEHTPVNTRDILFSDRDFQSVCEKIAGFCRQYPQIVRDDKDVTAYMDILCERHESQIDTPRKETVLDG